MCHYPCAGGQLGLSVGSEQAADDPRCGLSSELSPAGVFADHLIVDFDANSLALCGEIPCWISEHPFGAIIA